MEKISITGETVLFSKNIAILHKNKISEAHMGRMVHMCFSNIHFAKRILKYYLGFEEYDELFGDMIFLNRVNQKSMEKINTYFMPKKYFIIPKYIENRERKSQKVNVYLESGNRPAIPKYIESREGERQKVNTYFEVGNRLVMPKYIEKWERKRQKVNTYLEPENYLIVSKYIENGGRKSQKVNTYFVPGNRFVISQYIEKGERERQKVNTYFEMGNRPAIPKYIENGNRKLQKNIINNIKAVERIAPNKFLNRVWEKIFLVSGNILSYFSDIKYILLENIGNSIYRQVDILKGNTEISEYEKVLLQLGKIINAEKKTTVQRNMLLFTYGMSLMQTRREQKVFSGLTNVNKMLRQPAVGILLWKRTSGFLADRNVISEKNILQLPADRNDQCENSYVNYLKKIGFDRTKRDNIFLSKTGWNTFFKDKLSKRTLRNVFFFLKNTRKRFSEEMNTFRNNIENSMIDGRREVIADNRTESRYEKIFVQLESIINAKKETDVQGNLLTFAYAANQMQTKKERKPFSDLSRRTNRMFCQFAVGMLNWQRRAGGDLIRWNVEAEKSILHILREKNPGYENRYIKSLRPSLFVRNLNYIEEGAIFKPEGRFLFAREGKRFVEERYSAFLQKHSISQPNHIENKFSWIITRKFIGWNCFLGNNLSKWGLREIVNVKKGKIVQRNSFTTYIKDRMQACKEWRTSLNLANAGIISEAEEHFLFAKEGKASAAENYFILSNRHGINQFNHIDNGYSQDVINEVIDWKSFFEKLSTGALKNVFFCINNTFSRFSGKINAFRNNIVGKNTTQILKVRENRHESTYINYLTKIEFGKEKKERESFFSDIFYWIPEKTGRFLSAQEEREISRKMVYFIKHSSENEVMLKIQKQMQETVKELKQDMAEEMHKSALEQRTVRLLEEEVARQQERIKELELTHKRVQESFRNMKDIQKEKNNYLKVFGNEIKLERMRYGIPY